MTSEVQRQALTLLTEVWALSPDARLGQLLAHLGFLGEVHVGHGLGDIEDDELMAILARHKAELEARSQGSSMAALPTVGPSISASGSPIGVASPS
jgi:hypothetical protein